MYKVKRFSTSLLTKTAYKVSKPFAKNKTKLAKSLINKENSAKLGMFKAATNPGGLAADAVKAASERPVTGLLVTGGNLAAPVVPGITEGAIAIGKPIDKYAKSKAPNLYKAAAKVGSKVAPVARDVTNAAVNYAKYI